jgi:DHA1 family inner membrane transport protein
MVPPPQLWIVRSAAGVPNLASSTNIGAFNLGNAVGAAISAAALSAGLGVHALPIGGAVLALLALAVVLSDAGWRRQSTALSPASR